MNLPKPGSRTRLLISALWLLSGAAVVAQDQPLAAPPPPPSVESGQELEPQVTIRRTERETIYEYRRNGQLFLVRVQPRFGPPYHFVDVNGDGSLEFRPGEPVHNSVNQWILWRW